MDRSDEVCSIIGRFVLTFGSLETTLQKALIVLMNHFFPNDDSKYYKTITMILKQNNDFSANINILRFMVSQLIVDCNCPEWELLIKDLDYLMVRRNLYVHNMYGFDENEDFIKYKISNSYKKFPEFVPIQISELKKDCDLLQDRYRQLFDSTMEDEEIRWISKFPLLDY